MSNYLKKYGLGIVIAGLCHVAAAGARPNIIFILADDMGYGDVSCMNPEAKFKTPNLDAMADHGLMLTDAHTSSGVCTPSRYSVLTGRYCWRSKMKRGVLGGYSPALIEDGRETMASVLKARGYNTACIGKWHLGMNFPTTDGKKAGQKGGGTMTYRNGKRFTDDGEMKTNVDWSGKIERSPTSNGFDYFFGINGSLDMPPYVYIENDRFTGTPTAIKAFHRPGPATVDFEAEQVIPELTDRLLNYIRQQDGTTPFFVYFPITGPHNPVVPAKAWQGKSGIGAYGDFCMQIDHHVGQIMQALKDKGFYENTIVVFSSDNGVENHAYEQFRKTGHNSSAAFRGVKRDLWEGGHHVPTLVQWPAVIAPGRVSNETVCLTDFMPTFAEIADFRLPENAAEDGVSLLPIFQGLERRKPLRAGTVHHSLKGEFAIRVGNWVFIDAPDGNDRDNEPDWYKKERGYLPHNQPGELYDLSVDPWQRKNVYAEHPERVQQMKALLELYKAESRSVPAERRAY
ncbi:sulfatase family protein [Pontiella agarivorans]|uniref:Arylsulfatase n=1 Tax=Pontiella agarivorans TaxID=3038953 RepID=A0ABU5MUQ6_9BACT|nr:arylsulfatase [Pontiella agarivorans]MDZ8117701.1 arylsulfatase [Pontiella agarivorans]